MKHSDIRFSGISQTILLFFAFCASALALVSCSEKDDPDKTVITGVTISNDPENALRYPVAITTNSECELSISYWPVDEPAKERTTKAVRTTGNKADITIIFVKAQTDYQFCLNVDNRRQSEIYDFRTSPLPAYVPVYKVVEDTGGAPDKGYIFQWQATKPGYYTFCDMDGNVVWYQQVDQASRLGFFNQEDKQIYVGTGYSLNYSPGVMVVRYVNKIYSMDLYGNKDMVLNVQEEPVKYTHHELRMLPDGNLISVRTFTKNFDLTQFGMGEDEEVWGDGYIIFDRTGKEITRWDVFDEYTPYNSNNVILEAEAVYDFTHCNSVNYDSEGNYYMTFNRIRQLWKVDPRTGKVLYRVGANGNVALADEWIPEGVHAAVPLAPDKVMVLDNGEKRGYSRTLIYEIDPVAMTATVSTEIKYPNLYSSSDRSNSEMLPDGKTVMFSSTEGRACVFTDMQGNILKVITRDDISYRALYYEDIIE